MNATTRSMVSVGETALFVAFELSQREWKLALTSGFGVRPLVRTVAARDLDAVARVVAEGRRALGVAAGAPLVSCYEAGREGFWIHHALVARGWNNRVVDSASIEVSRRRKRAKTDRIDAVKLVTMLVRAWHGERQVWREVRVPSLAAEAQRQVSRERTALVQERTALFNQLHGWLATCGATVPARREQDWWTTVRDWAGAPLPAELQARIVRAEVRIALLQEQLAAIDAAQRARVQAAAPDAALRRLVRVKGVSTTSASVLVDEGLEWRDFQNRRELGGFLGFTPTPFASGDTQREQGISRAGNARVQATAVQLAWSWIRWQPFSPLTLWFKTRFGTGKRARKIGIIAVARKLLILLWRWVRDGVPPEGALLRAA